MFPWGAIVGLAGQTVSGIASALNNKKQQQAADAEVARQVAYNEAKATENPLSQSGNKRILSQYDRDSQQQIENARNTSVITGATPEYALGVQKAIAEGRADLMGKMSADTSERADKYNDEAEKVRHQKVLDDQERRKARNTTYANLAANAASAAGSIIDSYSTRPHIPKMPTTPLTAKPQGVPVSTPPANIEQQIEKTNTALAAIKRRNKW